MRAMKIIFPVILSLIAFSSVDAQKKTINGKKIKEIKEWKIDSGKRTLSELSKYDANGERIEQIKYETNGNSLLLHSRPAQNLQPRIHPVFH